MDNKGYFMFIDNEYMTISKNRIIQFKENLNKVNSLYNLKEVFTLEKEILASKINQKKYIRNKGDTGLETLFDFLKSINENTKERENKNGEIIGLYKCINQILYLDEKKLDEEILFKCNNSVKNKIKEEILKLRELYFKKNKTNNEKVMVEKIINNFDILHMNNYEKNKDKNICQPEQRVQDPFSVIYGKDEIYGKDDFNIRAEKQENLYNKLEEKIKNYINDIELKIESDRKYSKLNNTVVILKQMLYFLTHHSYTMKEFINYKSLNHKGSIKDLTGFKHSLYNSNSHNLKDTNIGQEEKLLFIEINKKMGFIDNFFNFYEKNYKTQLNIELNEENDFISVLNELKKNVKQDFIDSGVYETHLVYNKYVSYYTPIERKLDEDIKFKEKYINKYIYGNIHYGSSNSKQSIEKFRITKERVEKSKQTILEDVNKNYFIPPMYRGISNLKMIEDKFNLSKEDKIIKNLDFIYYLIRDDYLEYRRQNKIEIPEVYDETFKYPEKLFTDFEFNKYVQSKKYIFNNQLTFLFNCEDFEEFMNNPLGNELLINRLNKNLNVLYNLQLHFFSNYKSGVIDRDSKIHITAIEELRKTFTIEIYQFQETIEYIYVNLGFNHKFNDLIKENIKKFEDLISKLEKESFIDSNGKEKNLIIRCKNSKSNKFDFCFSENLINECLEGLRHEMKDVIKNIKNKTSNLNNFNF